MPFRFVHTADLHLDSPLVALALREPALAESLGVATRTALARIVDLCLAERVDALLIAGDLWDGRQTSAKTPRFLKQELIRLAEGGVRTFIIRGNHDALSRATRELDPPPGTVIFDARPRTETIETPSHTIALHGVSFAEPAAPESLLPLYPAPVPGAFNIGLMHTSLNGSPGHDTYAPCRLADLDAHGYDYWALGHVHRRAEYQGRATVVMPGIPQGRDIGEAGASSVTLATLADDGTLTLEERCVAPLRFERLDLDLTGLSEWSETVAALDGALRAAERRPGEDHLVLRPRLTGATPLAWRIARDLDRLAEEARAVAADGLWIDRLENATTAPEGAAAGALPQDLLDILAGLPADPGLRAGLADLAREVQRELPAELRDLRGEDEAGLAAACEALLAEGAAQVLARLVEGEG